MRVALGSFVSTETPGRSRGVAIPSARISRRPANALKWPRTVAMPMCLTWKPTLECFGSTTQVPTASGVVMAVSDMWDIVSHPRPADGRREPAAADG